jgi:TonB-linked SusC/RagA family outer membrane protein
MYRNVLFRSRQKQQWQKYLLLLLFFITPVMAMAQQSIKGIVTDATKDPLPGVTIQASKTNVVVSDVRGEFQISASVGDVITFSYLGFKNQEYKVTGKETLVRIFLEEDTKLLQEVVVEAGIIKRDKLGFTGSYATISAEELKSTGNTNLIQSLKSLDPSFVVMENTLAGSNPNAMANIEMRGQTSMNISSVQDEAAVSSNLPLFVLDGFEATIQEINDLDVNRVMSITLLKDAGSTAIYGSKGANGVVVIETIRPTAGKIFVTYNGDFQLAAPDLSAYNMMNAEEKLEFERLAGRYNFGNSANSNYDVSTPSLGTGGTGALQASYYERLARVKSGVDTYWLSEPVRNAFTQAHSVTIAGGEKTLLFSVGLNYKANPGVMKGSQRDTYGGNVKLVYRGVAGLNIQNNTFLTGTNAESGSWGSFADFVNANPYYTKRNADGSIPKYLDQNGSQTIAINPLYNASLNTRHDEKLFNVTNNTSLDWSITDDLLLRANLSLKRNTTNQVDIEDPANSKFDNTPYNEKGSYQSAYISYWYYNANATLNYLKSVQKNNFTFIGRYNIEESNDTRETFTVVGFPEGAVIYPSNAFSYEPGKRAFYATKIGRKVGFVGAFNYNYDFRYLLDLNYNLDGSSNFGRNKRFQSFYSVGAGWNIHRESFAKNWGLGELKLRGNYGINGNQDVNVSANSIYSYSVGNSPFGQSAYLMRVGNKDLRWQVVGKLSAGLDVGALNDNLKVNLDVYNHKADPQIVILDQRPSTGVENFPLNLGYLTTKGYEFKIYYNLINRPKDNLLVSLRLTGAHKTSTYGGFANSLEGLNDAYKKQDGVNYSLNSLNKYVDGHSPQDLWAVRSKGIDPATGREVFLTKDGEPTFVYNPDDRVVIANTSPDLEGIFGFTVRYKKLMLNANIRYYTGASTYNQVLFNKVENITGQAIIYNQDKRALYDRWKKEGDISQFRAITMFDTERTPVSSRFIQKNDYLKGESAKLTWNFTGDKWLKKFKLQDFSASVSMNDFFYLSSIKVERGIDYPFQRAVIMNISARF